LALPKERAPRNRTLSVTSSETDTLARRFVRPAELPQADYIGRTIVGDCFEILPKLPKHSVDLLILDPPYNLNKKFGGNSFSRMLVGEYTDWLRKLLSSLSHVLKPTATIYICGDWLSSASVYTAASEFFTVRNRITWEREKGRGAQTNWKNSSEDIWFCTVSEKYTFNVDEVKLRRRVIAPYRDLDGKPLDWTETNEGNFRDTYPSNIWTDITIPFWSMPENTDHPTQKSEKLIAKLMLASSNAGDVVFDPFLGSGTTSVVAQKLNRKFFGIELEEEYALLAEKRLQSLDVTIQGYMDRVFWERNTLNSMTTTVQKSMKKRQKSKNPRSMHSLPFDEAAE